MGDVYLARRAGERGAPLVALKVIRPELASSPRFARMFLREGRVLASLDHPNVVKVLDLGDDDGTLFLAMEYLQGATLRAFRADLSRW